MKFNIEDRLIIILNILFLFLALFHILQSTQEIPMIDVIEDSRIQYCFGDEELQMVFDEEANDLFGLEDLPFCVGSGLTQSLVTYVEKINNSNKITNLYSAGGYFVAFLITFIPLIFKAIRRD